jgi:hypothetical protein
MKRRTKVFLATLLIFAMIVLPLYAVEQYNPTKNHLGQVGRSIMPATPSNTENQSNRFWQYGNFDNLPGMGLGVEYGHLRQIVANASTTAVLTSQTGQVFTNTGVNPPGSITLTLPSASPGLEYTFVVTAGSLLVVHPQGAGNTGAWQSIMGLGTMGYGVGNGTSGGTLTLLAVNNYSWAVKASYGTWTNIGY